MKKVWHFDDELWYQPGYLLQMGVDAEKFYTGRKIPTEIRKAIEETRLAAMWAFGMNNFHNMELFLQPVNEEAPDVRALFEVPSQSEKFPLDAKFIDVEVTRYEEHSSEPLGEFLTNGKLKKNYEPGTTILAVVDKDVSADKSWKDISAELQKLSIPFDVFLLGRTHPVNLEYAMARVYPEYDSIFRYEAKKAAAKAYKIPQAINIAKARGKKFTKSVPRGFNPFTDAL